jgi:hypothetical protein
MIMSDGVTDMYREMAKAAEDARKVAVIAPEAAGGTLRTPEATNANSGEISACFGEGA